MQQTGGTQQRGSPPKTSTRSCVLKSRMRRCWRFITICFTGLAGFVGTARFFILQCVFVLSGVVLNPAFPHHAFDEYPFPLLAITLALEAVVLTSCVLIRQSLIDRTLDRRDHLELQINLLSREGSHAAAAHIAAVEDTNRVGYG
jgi:uncharacterized membrane protein